jgi:hypothetical protein
LECFTNQYYIYVGNHTGKFQLSVIGLAVPVLVLLLVLSAARTGTDHPSFFERHFLSLPTCLRYIPSSFHHSSSTGIVSAHTSINSKTMADPRVNPAFAVLQGAPPDLPGDPFVVGGFVIEGGNHRSTDMVTCKITVPVMQSRHIIAVPIW